MATAEKFSDNAYDFIEKLANPIVGKHPLCGDEMRKSLGLKYRVFRKKYTVVFIETDEEIIVTEILTSN